MKKILTYKGAVMTWESDSNGHMNVMYYINKFEHAGRNFEMELKLGTAEDREKVGMVVLEQQVKYLKEVFENDLLYIESSLVEVGNKAFTLFHEMYNARSKELVCTMRIVLVLFDKVNRKALPLPPERKTAMEAHLQA